MSEFRTFRVIIPGNNELWMVNRRRELKQFPEIDPGTETDIILNLSHIVAINQRGEEVFIVTINSTWKSADDLTTLKIALDAQFIDR